jgi:hypothetical protein
VNALTIGKLLPLADLHHRRHLVHRSVALLEHAGRQPRAVSAAAILLIFAYGGYEVTGVLPAKPPTRARTCRLRSSRA